MPRRDPQLPSALQVLGALATRQAGTCTTSQARSVGVSEAAQRRLLDQGRWTRLHRGVLLLGAETPGPEARAWGAHLASGPGSVIAGSAAGFALGILTDAPALDEPVEVMVPDPFGRQIEGLRLRHVRKPELRRHPAKLPPVLTVEFTVIDLVRLASTDARAVGIIEAACRVRLTTPARILAAAGQLPRVRRRNLIKEVCADVRAGITTPLKRRYHQDVALPHRLPFAVRQAHRAGARSEYADLRYRGGVVVELDGRLGHETEWDAFRDHRRDNASALRGDATLRFGWIGITATACEAAAQVAQLLWIRGTQGPTRGCRPGCPVHQVLGRVA